MTAGDGAWTTEAISWPSRAGFLRRAAAFLIDYLLVFLLLVAVVAGLFRLTNGAIQGDFTLKFGICYDGEVTWNGGSSPLPEYGAWKLCNTSLLGLTTASQMVGTNSSTGAKLSLSLGADGTIRRGALNLGFLEGIALFLYFFVTEWKTGKPIGKRIMAIAVRDEDNIHRDGLPILKVVRRCWMKFLGVLPLTVLQGWYAFQEWGGTPDPLQQISNLEIIVTYIALALAPIWMIWIAISIAIGNDPIHDRFAGTSVRQHQAET